MGKNHLQKAIEKNHRKAGYIHWKPEIDSRLSKHGKHGKHGHYESPDEHIAALSDQIEYLEGEHYKVRNKFRSFSKELPYNYKELLSYIEAKLKAIKKQREKVIEDNVLKENTNKNRTDKPTKTERVTNFADSFIDKLLKGNFETNNEVIDALQKIEPDYKPVGNKERQLLKKDGRPYEKRICIALSDIFKIRQNDENIDWTTIRDYYKSVGKKIQ